MSAELIKYAFVAGEISPTFFGRSDLEKYDLGVARATNWFVDYRGGLSTRAGTRFVDYLKHDDQEIVLFPFLFAPNLANTYIIVFGHEYIRFIQDGAYVLESDVTVSGISQSNPGVVTATAHGYSTGDWVYLDDVAGMTEVNGRLFEVGATTTNTFGLRDPFGNDFDTRAFDAYTSGGTANRVYTVTSPYSASDLPNLRGYQIRDTVRLTHPSYSVRNLVRTSATNWSISVESIGTDMPQPSGLAGTASDAGSASVVYAVTAVSYDDEESLASEILVLDSIVNFTSTAGSVTLTWNEVDDARYYNVYRSNVFPGSGSSATDVTRAAQLGFLGQSFGPTFTDTNIVPDFTVSPPRGNNPFAHGSISRIEVTNAGSGYDKNDTVTVSGGGGSGFVGFPVVNDSGEVISVVIQNGGAGYSSPTVTFNTSTGSGATATATVSPATGNNPATASIHQSRQIYAGSNNQPLTVWGSRPGLFSNFDVSESVNDGDAYEFDLESEEVARIEHLASTRQGLLLFSRSGIWRVHGGADEIVTPLNAVAVPQSSRGCSPVSPLKIDNDLLYVEGKSRNVRLLEYNDITKVFNGVDMSILSNHLFDESRQISAWAYAQNPHNLIWAVRSDGALLAFTLVKDQEVFAWTPNYTRGLFEDVTVVQENGVDVAYFVVKRYVNGRWTKFIERLFPRTFLEVEDAWCVDCGLSRELTYPAADLTLSAPTGDVTLTASTAVFTAGDVGKVIFGNTGKATITSYVSATSVEATVQRDFETLHETDDFALPITSGNWSMDAPVTTLSGLHHIEGMTVRVLGDGNVFTDKVVTDGAITLEHEAIKIIVGLGFDCIAQTLPPSSSDVVIEARRKRIVGTAVGMHDTRGLKVGADLDHLYEMKERTTELYGQPIRLQSEVKSILIDADWDVNGQTMYVQDNPLPATILGLVTDLEVGDDTR